MDRTTTGEADFRLDDIDGVVTAGKDIERWEKALELLDIGDMPPDSADKHPNKADRRAITAWIHSPPDAPLPQAAAEGKLSTREDVEREVRRMNSQIGMGIRRPGFG